ncbi:MAG: 2-succinyl-5-enolpyruvyl-6-hydroxy-3-cyclohexene-1-carboxylic-acid synthase [Actinomycetota bacterium]
MNPSQAFGYVLVDELVRCGLTHACCAPGSRSAPVALALAEDPRVRLHVLIDERSAAFCALGIAKAAGLPVVVLSTSGTAAANFSPAVIEARHSATPLVVLTADRPPELRDTGANQTIDQVKLYGDAVAWFAEVGAPEALPSSVAYWRSLASRVYASALGPPAGPVHLNLPLREPLVPMPDGPGFPYSLEGRPGGEPWTRRSRSPRPGSQSDLERLASEIAVTERGLIIVGDAEVDAEAVQELARAACWPVLADPLSGARCGELALSSYEALLRHRSFARAHRPDLVLRIGRTGASSRTISGFLDRGIRQVLLDPTGAWLDPDRAAAWLLEADPELALREMRGRLPRREASSWLGSWLGADRAAREAIDALLEADDVPSEPRTARDLAARLPQGATLVAASSMPIRDLDWFMRSGCGLRVLGNRGASGIDGFVSTVLGVALATDGPTVGLAGDLSLLHDQNGFLLPRNEAVDAVFVVVNNDGGGIFSFLPQAELPEHFEKLFGTPHGLDLATLAHLYGCGYRRVDRADELAPLVSGALDTKGVHLIEVPSDRRANVAVHRQPWEAAARALDDLMGV